MACTQTRLPCVMPLKCLRRNDAAMKTNAGTTHGLPETSFNQGLFFFTDATTVACTVFATKPLLPHLR